MEPASLPAFSRELDEEGVIIPPVLLTDEVLDALRRATRATRTSAAATCAPRSPRTGSPSGGSTSCARAAGATASRRRWTSSTRTRSGCVRAAIAALPDGRR